MQPEDVQFLAFFVGLFVTVAGTALTAGQLSQRVNGHDSAIGRLEKTLDRIDAKLTEHLEVK